MGKNSKKRRRLNDHVQKESIFTTAAVGNEEGPVSHQAERPQNVKVNEAPPPPLPSKASDGSKKKESKSSRKKKKKKLKRSSSKSKSSEDSSSSTTTNNGLDDADKAEETTATAAAAETTISFPYPTDADDHCETPQEAYQHIVPFLQKLAQGYRKTSCQSLLRIYDPYYCDGAVKRNFAALGFPNVYNEKQDCYEAWKEEESSSSSLPEFDVLVTNPPYSGDHIERLMEFLSSKQFGNRPWCLLLPNWVHKKDYFLRATTNGDKTHSGSNDNNKRPPLCQPFYLVPRKRYVYLPPKGFREAKKSDVHKKASPFVSMWYIWGGTPEKTQELIQHYYQTVNKNVGGVVEYDLARTKSALRDLRRKKR